MGITDRLKGGARKVGGTVKAARSIVREGLRAAGVRAKYEAGSRRKRLRDWTGDKTSIDTETRRSLGLIRQRSRDLVANHWAASRAKSVIQRNVVGSGIRPTVKGDASERMHEAVADFCCTTKLDPARRKTLYALQELIMGAIVESGEVLVVRQRRTSAQMRQLGLDLPLQIAVLEPDYLDPLVDGPLQNGNRSIQGVEIDPDTGAVVAYHLYRQHPGDVYHPRAMETIRVDARHVIHAFEEIRPGQSRGLPWGVSALIKMRDLSDYEDAQLVKQKVAAAFAAFVHHQEPYNLDDLYDPDGVPTTMQPGTVEYLRPGEDVTFSDPPRIDGFKDFSEVSVRAIAAAYNVTYEALASDYSNVNFSSGRMGWLEMQRHVDSWQGDLLIPQVCHRIEGWIREAAADVGIDPSGPRWKWTPPRREMIDPSSEVNASIRAVRGGLNSLSDEIRKLGRDPAEVFEEIADDYELMDALGIVLDSNASQTTQAGLTPTAVTQEMHQEEQ